MQPAAGAHGRYRWPVTDADGPPTSYLTLKRGTEVYTSDGARLGTVEQVLQVPEEDVFSGIVVRTAEGARLVERDDIASLAERAVRLTIDAKAARELAPPSGTPTFKADPTAGAGQSLRSLWSRLFRRGGWKRVS
jgi:sporulation protein YlmC with PRC-barrel domain